jgi:ABC-type transporter Mla MlaB component
MREETYVLKITEMPGQAFRLEGKLLGPWVDELRSACTPPLERHELVQLNLAAVTFVDAAGAELLRELINHGVAITGCSGFVAALLYGAKE